MLHKDAEKLFENPGNVSFLKSWKDELQHKITNHVKAKPGELVVSPFILGKVQETQRSVLHKPRDSFYNVTIQYIIAYILDNRKLYAHPSSGALALFLDPKGAPCLLCMLAVACCSSSTGQNLHGGVLSRLRWQSGQVPHSGLAALVLWQGCNASAKCLCIPEKITNIMIRWNNVGVCKNLVYLAYQTARHQYTL